MKKIKPNLNKLFSFVLLFQFLLLIYFNVPGQFFTEEADFIKIGNSEIEFQFQRLDGELYSLIDKNANVDFISEKSAWWTLYTIYYMKDNTSVFAGGWNAKSFNYDTSLTSEGIILDLIWDGFQTDIELDIKVKVSIEISGNSSFTYWHIQIDNNASITIEGVVFPEFSGIGKIGSNSLNDYLVYPGMSGLLFQDPLVNFNLNGGWGWEQSYPSAFGNMQFTAYYSIEKNSGIYLASEDPDGNRKSIHWSKPDENWMEISIKHTPIFGEGNDFDLPFKVKLGIFTGDWYDAARIYKSWAISQPWLKKGTISERTDIPIWFKSLPLHMWILTHPFEYPDSNPFSILSERSNNVSSYLQVPLAMDWIGWENTGWYINYPDVFPPKEGWDSFDETISNVKTGANHILTIICCTALSSLAQSFNEALNYAMIDRNGEISRWGNYSEGSLSTIFYTMCPKTDYWKRKISELTTTLANHGLDIIQMDGFPLTVPICYDTIHRHPIGGGNWWFQEYYNLFDSARIEAKSSNPDIAFSTEAMGESFIPLFDSYWDPFTTGICPTDWDYKDVTKIQMIPLWHALYHDYILLQSGISLYATIEGEENYYKRGTGLALVWGEAPTTFDGEADIAIDIHTEMVEYLKRVVQARYTYAREFLIYGEMMRPPEINVPEFLIPGASKIPYTGVNCPPFYSSSVLSSCWKSPYKSIGYILTNISDQEVTFELEITDHDLIISNYDIYKILNGSYSILSANTTLPNTETIKINPGDVLLIAAYPAAIGDNDLSISNEDIEINTDTLNTGQSMKINLKVHNNGDSDVHAVTVCLYDKDPFQGGNPVSLIHTIPVIRAGEIETTELIFRSTGLFNEQNIYVKVDPTNLLSETNENNNIAYKSLFIKAPSILFDESHDETNTLSWQRALSLNSVNPEWHYFGQFKNRIEQEFYIQSLYNGPITIDSLKEFQILILAAPQSSFQSGEINAIHNFVEYGGTLFIIGDASIPVTINNISEKFGITFNSIPIASDTSAWDAQSFLVTELIPHDINQNINSIHTNWSSSLDIAPPAYAISYTDSTTWRDANRNGLMDDGETAGPFVFGALSLYGNGAAVFIADNAFHEGIFNSNDNGKLIINILRWLKKLANPSFETNTYNIASDFSANYLLYQNYPNPFSTRTVISYQLPYSAHVIISIYNIMGQRIATLLDEKKETGYYNIKWEGLDQAGHQVSNGLYFIEMKADNFHSIKKALLLR